MTRRGMNALKAFMRAASAEQQDRLAAESGTTRQYLYKLANSGAAYARSAKAGLAAALERVSHAMHKDSKGLLPKLYRTDLNDTCRECPYAQRCLKDIATRSHFEILEDEQGTGDGHVGDK